MPIPSVKGGLGFENGYPGSVYFNEKPSSPILVTPYDKSPGGVFPTFDWTDSIDSDGTDDDDLPGDGTPVSYDLQISTSLDFASLYAGANLNVSLFISTQPLAINTTYYWRVHAFDGQSYTDWTTPWSVTADSTPPTGQNIISLVPHITSATVTVAIATDAINTLAPQPYFTEASTAPSFAFISASSNWQSSNIWDAVGLSPDTTYFFRTKARDASLNETPWTSTTSVKTLTTRPDSLGITLLGSTSVQIAWGSGINPAGTQFSVQITSDAAFLPKASTVTLVSGLTQSFTGLSPNASYFIRIANKDYVSFPSEFASSAIISLPNPAVPSAITNVSTGSLTALWTGNGNPGITEYVVEASSSVGGATWTTNPWSGALTRNFFGLSANVTYYFRMKGRNSVLAEGSFSAMQATATLAVPPPPPAVEGRYDPALPNPNVLEVTPDFGANSPETEMSIESFDDGGYLQGDGTLGPKKVWKTRAQWLTGGANREIVEAPLRSSYQYRVYARNFNGLETGFFLPKTGVVDTFPPSGHGINSLEAHISSVTLTLSAATDPNGLADNPYWVDTSTSPNFIPVLYSSDWISKVVVDVAGLSQNTTYFFRVKARDIALNESSWDNTSMAITLPAPLQFFPQEPLPEAPKNVIGNAFGFPNPSRGSNPIFRVESESAERMNIRIYNLAGELVTESDMPAATFGTTPGFEWQWNADGVAPGIYQCVVTAHKDGQAFVKRFRQAVKR